MPENSLFFSPLPQAYWIKSQRIVFQNSVISGWILIENEKITVVNLTQPDSHHPVFDMGNLVVMAGLVDPHVHINEPGRTDWEGFESATKAASAGGITTIIEMPLNASPVTTTRKNFELKQEAAQGKTWVNCGFWGGLVPENVSHISDFLTSGIFGLKAFMTHSGIDEFPNVGEKELKAGMKALKERNLPLLAHAEWESENPYGSLLHKFPQSYAAYLASRPDQWEVDAVQLLIQLCRETGCKTHIVHVSSALCLPLIRSAKQEGLPLTAETCPHYLVFSAEDIPDGDTRFKCAPPIRGRKNNAALWDALKDGTLDFVASDHSPAPPDLKEIQSGNLQKAWGGISGLQFGLPLLWAFGQPKGWDIPLLARLLAENPARLPGLALSKGQIAHGFDADLCIWDPEASWTITSEKTYHRHTLTPYQDMEVKGKVVATIVNGKLAYMNEQFSPENSGKILLNAQ